MARHKFSRSIQRRVRLSILQIWLYITSLLSEPESKTLSKLKLCSSIYLVISTLFLKYGLELDFSNQQSQSKVLVTAAKFLLCFNLLKFFDCKILYASHFEHISICLLKLFASKGSLPDNHSDLRWLLSLLHLILHL